MYGLSRKTATTRQLDSGSSDNEEGQRGDDRCYVDVRRICAARLAILESKDALGRPPLFVAAAAGSCSVTKELIRCGAASTLAVRGTGLAAHSVASSLLMKRILSGEARLSLDKAILVRQKRGYHGSSTGAIENEPVKTVAQDDQESLNGRAVADDDTYDIETGRMEAWLSTLVEGELAATLARATRVDQKTSLHLAATAGLPQAVGALVERGVGKRKVVRGIRSVGRGAERARSERPGWTSSLQPPNALLGEIRFSNGHCAHKHRNRLQDFAYNDAETTDVDGWSPLHACCAENSPPHYHCALTLLGKNWDPNARTNTGKTPLYVAACVEDATGVGGGVRFQRLTSVRNFFSFWNTHMGITHHR